MLSKKDLCCEQLSSSKDSEIIFCKIKIKGKKPLIVGSAYRPPNLDFENSKILVSEIYKVMDTRLEIVGNLETRCPGNLGARGKFHGSFLDKKKGN